MKTVLTRSPEEAAAFIRGGGVVAFPTETVYGLGADVFDDAAVGKVFEAKGRPADNPLIAHVSDIGQIERLTRRITPSARKFIRAFFPGPLTVVLPKAAEVPERATAGLGTIGVRMPRHPLALELIERSGTPLVAPSANLSGRPSPTDWRAVFEDLKDRIDCILRGETTAIGLESTVVDCTGRVPEILRAGAVTPEDLQRIVPATRFREHSEADPPKSPGLRHRHYSPRARVVLVGDEPEEFGTGVSAAWIGLRRPAGEFVMVEVCGSVEDYARRLFGFFRRCDRRGIDVIYCEEVEEKGLGLALMDRLRRAARG